MADKRVTVTVDTKDKASKDLQKIGKTGKQAGQSIAAGFIKAQLSIAGVRAAIRGISKALRGLTTDVAKQGDEFAKMSKRTGIAVETLSAMAHAAELSGTSFNSVAKSLQLLSKNAYDMKQGTGEAKIAFTQLGVSVTDAEGKLRGVDDLFGEIADKLRGLSNDSERLAISRIIFGRGGADILPLLREGRDGIKAMTDEARRLGLVWTEGQAKMAEAYNDAFTRLRGAITGIRNAIGTQLLPAMTEFADKVTAWLVDNRETIKQRIIDAMRTLANFIIDIASVLARTLGDLKDLISDVRGVIRDPTGIKGAARRAGERAAGWLGAGNHPALGGPDSRSTGERWAGKVEGIRATVEALLPRGGGGRVVPGWGQRLTGAQMFGGPTVGVPGSDTANGNMGGGFAERMGLTGSGGYGIKTGAVPMQFSQGLHTASNGPGVFQNAGQGFVDGINKAVRAAKELDGTINRLGSTFATTAATGMAQFFDNIQSGAMSASEAFKQMARDIIRSLQAIAIQQAVMGAFGALTGIGGPNLYGAGGSASFAGQMTQAIDTSPTVRSTIAGAAGSTL